MKKVLNCSLWPEFLNPVKTDLERNFQVNLSVPTFMEISLTAFSVSNNMSRFQSRIIEQKNENHHLVVGFLVGGWLCGI